MYPNKKVEQFVKTIDTYFEDRNNLVEICKVT